MVGQVPVFEPGELFMTMADGIPRAYGVNASGEVVLITIHTEDPGHSHG